MPLEIKRKLRIRLKTAILFSFLVLSLSVSNAQSWLWARQPVVDTSAISGGDPQLGDHYVAVDNLGNAYISGFFLGGLTFGADTLVSMGGAYLVKYNAGGNVVWARQSVGNQGSAQGTGVAIDYAGNVCTTGFFGGNVIFGTDTLYNPGPYFLLEMYLVKYDANGNVIWAHNSSFASSACECYGAAVAMDKWGNIYVTGSFKDTVSFGNDTLKQLNNLSATYLVKYNASGNVVWARQSTNLTDSAYDQGNSVAVDNLGNVFVTGSYYNKVAFGMDTISYYPGPLTGAVTNMFILKYDNAGNVVWLKTPVPVADGSATGASVSADKMGNAYVTGDFQDTVSFGTDSVNGYGMFLVKYNPMGNALWADQNGASYVSWNGITVYCDTLKRGGGYLLADGTDGLNPAEYKLQFGGVTDSVYGQYSNVEVVLQFDSAGHTLCESQFSEGDEDDGTSVGVSPTSQYIYVTGDMYTGFRFGNDSLTEGNDVTFTARWQPCCTSLSFNDTTICKGSNVTLNAIGGTSYLWNTNATSSSINVNPSNTTGYNVKINRPGCNTDSVIQVLVVDSFQTISLCCNDTILSGSPIGLSVSPSNLSNYQWSPAEGLSCTDCTDPIVSPIVTTKYTVTYTNKYGCSTDTAVTVYVKPICNIYIPNAFSPNGDGLNETFAPKGECIASYSMNIYNRWGYLLYSTSTGTPWNGNCNNKKVPEDIYTYQINLMDVFKQQHAYIGSVAVLK